MNRHVFGCPTCNQRFQVLTEHAGTIVQCPICTATVQIPADAFETNPSVTANTRLSSPNTSAKKSPAAHSPAPPQVYHCIHCQGPFGITPEMLGTQVGCPHCQQLLVIADPQKLNFKTPAAIESSEIEEAPIQIKKQISGKKRDRSGFKSPNKIAQTNVEVTDLIPPIKRGRKRHTEKSILAIHDLPESEITETPSAKPKSDAVAKPKNQTTNTPQNKSTTKTKLLPSSATPAKFDSATAQSVAPDASATTALSPPSLLPPRFNVNDPTQLSTRRDADNKIVLPDGSGGQRTVDQRVVHVEYNGQTYALIALTPQQRLRRRIISNLLALIISIITLVLVFRFLVS